MNRDDYRLLKESEIGLMAQLELHDRLKASKWSNKARERTPFHLHIEFKGYARTDLGEQYYVVADDSGENYYLVCYIPMDSMCPHIVVHHETLAGAITDMATIIRDSNCD